MPIELLDLPSELLAVLPNFIRNLEDFNNARCTCRTLRNIFDDTSPRTILSLAASSAPTFFSPHPYFLVAGTARSVAAWVLSGKDADEVSQRTAEFMHALRGGIEGLYDLCVQRGRLTLQDVRRLHLARFDILNPLSDRIDKMAGKQWMRTPHFWNGGVSEPYTLYTDADRATFQIVIYGELFGSSMDAWLSRTSSPGVESGDGSSVRTRRPLLDRTARLEYVKYCVPDQMSVDHSGTPSVGPYAEGREESSWMDQVVLNYILRCGRWMRMWQAVLGKVGPVFEDEWRQELWWAAVVELGGLKGMELVTKDSPDDISDSWKCWLAAFYRRVRDMDKPAELDEMPSLDSEVYDCCKAYWGFR